MKQVLPIGAIAKGYCRRARQTGVSPRGDTHRLFGGLRRQVGGVPERFVGELAHRLLQGP